MIKNRSIIYILLVITIISLCGCGTGSNAASDANVVNVTTTAASRIYQVGDIINQNGILVRINSVGNSKSNGYYENEGFKYIYVDITVQNTKKEDVPISSIVCFEMKTQDGIKCDYDFFANLNNELDTTLAPGETISDKLIFEAPKDIQSAILGVYMEYMGRTDYVELK